jgi:hypothetical protein
VGRTAFLAAVLAAVVAVSAAAGEGARLEIDAGGKTVKATAGLRCVQVAEDDGTPHGECSAAKYPLATRGRLPLRPGGTVVLRFVSAPGQVKWRLLREAREDSKTVLSGLAARRPGTKATYVVRLPSRVPCARILDVYATYGAGAGKTDQDWWAGAKVRRKACR